MPAFITEYEIFGRKAVGPLIVVPDRERATAVCDVLFAPDGGMTQLRIIDEALVAVPGRGDRSRPRVTCECGHSIMVLMNGNGEIPTVAPHLPSGKRLSRHHRPEDLEGASLCRRSYQPIIMDPLLAHGVRYGMWRQYMELHGPYAAQGAEIEIPAISRAPDGDPE